MEGKKLMKLFNYFLKFEFFNCWTHEVWKNIITFLQCSYVNNLFIKEVSITILNFSFTLQLRYNYFEEYR